MNNGWIHKELRDFQGISSNLIKSETELRWEIKDFGRFRKKNPRRLYKIKNHAICISIQREIKEGKLERIIVHE